VVIASITAAFSTYTLVTQKEFTSLTAGAYVDAVLFSIIAWRIRRFSKLFAIAGVLLFIFEKIMQFSQGEGVKGLPLAILILLMFVSGVRGVFAYHRYSSNKQSTENA
jgi:predicted PurR-regulated permease PerM